MHVRSFQLSDASQMTELLQVALSEECYENTMGPLPVNCHGILT